MNFQINYITPANTTQASTTPVSITQDSIMTRNFKLVKAFKARVRAKATVIQRSTISRSILPRETI